MVAAPSFDRAEAGSLKMLNAGARRVAIGLHVTLTGKFKPMSPGFRPTRYGTFVSLAEMMVRGRLGLLDRRRLAAEIATQLEAFVVRFGQPPDFIDGHQHVHLFPQVREALLDVVKDVGAAGLGAPVRPRGDAAARIDAGLQDAYPRCAQRQIPGACGGARHRDQSGVCRRL